MKLPRLQFSLRGAMFATLWMAVAFGCYSYLNALHRSRVSSELEGPATWLMMIAPFVAAGALIGRMIAGGIVGLAAVASFWVLFYSF